MTVINAWWYEDGSEGRERRAFLQCDGCLPPHLQPGSAERLRAAGWRFDGLERPPHHCPWCSPRRRDKNRWHARPEKHPALPNIITIGAQKCGTTSFHSYLGLHPEIAISKTKEVNFFQNPGCLDDLDTYATFFDGTAPLRAETTPYYTMYPFTQGVPERIKAAIPGVKLIYLVRDPIDRAVSMYVHRVVRRRFNGFEDALGDIDDPYNAQIAFGRYATQLEQFVAVFGPERILVLDQADLMRDRRGTLRRVFRFVGADEEFDSPGFDSLSNTAARRRSRTRAFETLSRAEPTAALRRWLPRRARSALFAPVKRLTSRPMDAPPPLRAETRRTLTEVYVPEVERLRAITGQEFPTWQI
jgi:hypothetical protein